jgi:hypothetical protein
VDHTEHSLFSKSMIIMCASPNVNSPQGELIN